MDVQSVCSWSEEELFKLSCKDLKKIARQSNITNLNSKKKGELVKALLTSDGPILADKTEYANTTRGRVTRSRASIFPNLSAITNLSNVHDLLTETINKKNDISSDQITTSTRNSNKCRTKESKKESESKNGTTNISYFDTSEVFPIVSSIEAKFQALQEITNKSKLPSDDSEILTQSNYEKTLKCRTKLQKGVQNYIINSDSDTTVDCALELTLEKSKKTDKDTKVEEKSENKPKQQLKKRKKMEEKNCNFENNEKQLSVDKTFVEGQIEKNNEDKLNNSVLKVEIESGKIVEESMSHMSLGSGKRSDVVKSKRGRKRVQEIAFELIENTLECNKVGNVIADDNSPQKETLPSLKNLSTKSNGRKKKRSDVETHVSSLTAASDLLQEQQTSLRTNDRKNDSLGLCEDQNNKTPQPANMPVPVRSSTFILEDDGKTPSKVENTQNEKKFDLPKRSNTFTFDEDEKNSPRRASFRFSTAPTLPVINSPAKIPQKIEKSIGKRIVTASMKKGNTKPPSRQSSSSTLKKTIVKNTATPDAACRSKFGVIRKLPNFKAIHQKLFNNMESLGDNTKRKVERAQSLLQSPVVPRCALTLKNQAEDHHAVGSSSSKTALPPKVGPQELQSPTARKRISDTNMKPGKKISPARNNKPDVRKTPVTNKRPDLGKTPVTNKRPDLGKTPVTNKKPDLGKTPITNTKPDVEKIPINRFGFKNPIKKSDAKSIILKKLPSFNLEKKKDKERTLLQGVRMNKRFMLQMKMRQEKH